MEEGKLYILHNVSVLRNCANSHLANHEYKLAITRFSIVTSMGSETLSQLCCLKPIPLEVITESSEIPAYCIAQVYDDYGAAWFKLPNVDVAKLLNEDCHNVILSTELGAKTVAQRSSIENAKMIIAQPAPHVVLIEWIKKQKEDLRYQGFGGGRSGAPQAIENYYDELTSS
ncbi:hypothetical protein JHK82_024675 [Glycine max]|nr:hypothetical protein JHK85_025275 [Glycine max]KAG5133487.1 hypothetical protein JHK82_024675 [Glycine max]